MQKKKSAIKNKAINGRPKKSAVSGLYQSTRNSPRNYRPNYYSVSDTKKSITCNDRLDYLKFGRSLFSACPDLGGALMQKASWCVAPGSFTPLHTGTNTEWGDIAESWLTEQFFPVCSILGNNYPFHTLLNLTSLALDIDGDTGLILSATPSGFPQVGLIPSHRIGQRKDNSNQVRPYNNNKIIGEADSIVDSGKFSGYRIYDGVIVNDNDRPIGYRILGDTPEDDTDISSQNIQLLLEPEWQDQYRGISRIARSITDWEQQKDINEFLLRGTKLASSIGIKHKTETGDGSTSGFMAGAVEDPLAPGNSGVQFSSINGGEIYYLKSAAGEDIETLKNESPSQNTEAFISRIQKRALYSIGWPQELLDASKIGGASVRLVQDLVRKSIASRQATIERRARLIVIFGVAKAMKSGILPPNNADWYKWNFTRGPQLSVDSGYEAQNDINNLKLGITTLSDVVSKRGGDWYETRQQSQKEVEDLIDRAQAISKSRNIPFETALTLLSSTTPNQSPVSQPAQIVDAVTA